MGPEYIEAVEKASHVPVEKCMNEIECLRGHQLTVFVECWHCLRPECRHRRSGGAIDRQKIDRAPERLAGKQPNVLSEMFDQLRLVDPWLIERRRLGLSVGQCKI